MIKVKNNIFTVSGIEFIKFPEKDGIVPVVAKDSLCDMRFGKTNDFAKSDGLKYLTDKVLPKIEKKIGAENVLEFETDLTSLDGLDTYGKIKSKISLPTVDFYRKNVRIFDKYKLDKWWWLSTPDTTKEHLNDYCVSCVSPSGYFGNDYCNFNRIGVRPFCILKSKIFES